MRKIFIILIVLLISVVGYVLYKNYFVSNLDTKAEITQVYMCGDIPGVLLKGENGSYTGYEYELLTKTLAKMEKKFSIKDVKFPFAIKEAIESKEENVIISGGIDYEFHKEEIQKNKLRAVVYGELHPQFVHNKGFKDVANIKMKVGVQVGAYRPELFVKCDVEFVDFPEISDMIRALEEKKVDGIILDSNDKIFKDKLKNFIFKQLSARKACFILSAATKDEFYKDFESAVKNVVNEMKVPNAQDTCKKTENKVTTKPVNSTKKTPNKGAKKKV